MNDDFQDDDLSLGERANELVSDVEVQCPHCGESFSILVDTTQGAYETVEDCAVCCRPMRIVIECNPGEILDVLVDR